MATQSSEEYNATDAAVEGLAQQLTEDVGDVVELEAAEEPRKWKSRCALILRLRTSWTQEKETDEVITTRRWATANVQDF
eukprot:6176511-Pleurochrysis_carterae.AAC.2